ncbi:MAG: hypothetical protein OXN94_02350 [Chloroflexota bacterium]|nr:hypothetical protein [Chloroflexota bacterium]
MAAIVEVIVGMIFVYILLSILVTETNSLLSRATRLRSRNLRNTLDGIIQDPVMRAKVYTHPLIQLVKADPVLPNQRIIEMEAQKIARGPIGTVDWIEPATFVDVVLKTMKVEADQQMFGDLLNIIDGMPAGPERRGLRLMVNRVISTGEGMTELRQSLRFVQHRRVRSALADVLNQIDDQIGQLGLQPTNDASVMAGVLQNDNPYFRSALTAVMASAQSVDEVRANLENWFNNAMARASASYAAKMKTLSVVVALAIALTVNVDTLHIARTLWEDPIRREQISSEVNFSVQSGQLQTEVNEAAEGDQGFTANQAQTDSAAEDVIGTGAELANRLQDIQNLRLPIGWFMEDLSSYSVDHPARDNPNNLWNYLPENNPDGWPLLLLGKLLGIAATVIAAAQGAPFWFGIVNRVLSR